MPNKLTPRTWLVLLASAMALAACSTGMSTRLPDLETTNKPVMSSAEQERAIKEMLARKETHQSKAIDEINKSK